MTTPTTNTVALTTAFIDLSTFDEIEIFFYGGRSVNKFRKVIRRSNWFTVIAAPLNKAGSSGDFGEDFQATFSRGGDYITACWLRCVLPQVTSRAGWQARWSKNIGHNLLETAELMFNELTINKLSAHHLDFLTAFTVTASKRNGYDNMIGNIDPLTDPYNVPSDVPITSTTPRVLPATAINVPLPFYFTHDTTDAIPAAAAPFNDIRVQLKFKPITSLLTADQITGTTVVTGVNACLQAVSDTQIQNLSSCKLSNVQVWAHYAVVPNGDREKLAEELEIDTLVEQVQHIQSTVWTMTNNNPVNIDLRLTHSVRAIFFAARNETCKSDLSNYTTHSTLGETTNGVASINFAPPGTADPIATATLRYENADRCSMPWDYYSYVVPYYTCPVIPMETGYHLFSYCNNLCSSQPDGSTNFARLASASLQLSPSDVAVAQHALGQRFAPLVTASVVTILRFAGGAAGFPVL